MTSLTRSEELWVGNGVKWWKTPRVFSQLERENFMVLWVLVFIGRRQQVNHLGSLNTLFPPSIYGIDGSKVIMTVYKFKVASRDFISRGTN